MCDSDWSSFYLLLNIDLFPQVSIRKQHVLSYNTFMFSSLFGRSLLAFAHLFTKARVTGIGVVLGQWIQRF